METRIAETERQAQELASQVRADAEALVRAAEADRDQARELAEQRQQAAQAAEQRAAAAEARAEDARAETARVREDAAREPASCAPTPSGNGTRYSPGSTTPPGAWPR